MTDLVKVEDNGHVRTISLNRPEKKNALSNALAWGVVEAVEAAAKVDDVWVVAITGSGDAFCAGLDLAGGERYHPYTPQSAQLDDISWVGQFLLAIRKRCDKPVVGGINGVAVGAGLGLAMATDVRLVAKSARLMAGYTRIGGSPDAGLTITLPQAMGYERAMRFMMENRTANGDEAVAWGMAGEVVDDDKFADTTGRILPAALPMVADHAKAAQARHGQVARDHRHGATAALRGRQHPHRFRQRGRQRSAQGLLRKAQAGLRGQVIEPSWSRRRSWSAL